MLVDHAFALELRLHADLAQARVASPSHPIGVVHGSTQAEVETVSARQTSLDRDFVLVVDQLSHDSMAVSSRDSVLGKASGVSFCPRIAMQGNARQRSRYWWTVPAPWRVTALMQPSALCKP